MSYCGNKKCGIWMIVIIPVVIALHSFAFMYLWNLLVTDIFSLRIIDFWEALGLVAMIKLLFMVGHKGRCCRGKGKCHTHSKEYDDAGFKNRMKEHFTSKYCCDSKEDKDNIKE